MEYLSTGDLAGYTLLTVGEASSPGLAGDFNADGSVDGADFLAWQRGESPDPLGEDSLTAWKTNFGTSPPGAGISLAVPEPTAGALALLFPLVGRLGKAASNKSAASRPRRKANLNRRSADSPRETRPSPTLAIT